MTRSRKIPKQRKCRPAAASVVAEYLEERRLLAETPEWSALRDPHDGRTRLYRSADDWLQRWESAKASER